MDKWDEKILLRLRREYSKDETVAFLSKALSDCQIELGILKSEKAELIYRLSKLSKIKIRPKPEHKPKGKTLKEYLSTDEVLAELNKANKKLQTTNQALMKQINLWRDKYLNLLAKEEREYNNRN